MTATAWVPLAPAQPCPSCGAWCRVVLTGKGTTTTLTERLGEGDTLGDESPRIGDPVVLLLDDPERPALGIILGPGDQLRADVHVVAWHRRHVCPEVLA